jgi:hypothetical protein
MGRGRPLSANHDMTEVYVMLSLMSVAVVLLLFAGYQTKCVWEPKRAMSDELREERRMKMA